MKDSESVTYASVAVGIRNNSVIVSEESLERIIAKFSHIINSTRAMFYVRTLKDLLDILEERAIDGRDQEEFSASLVEYVNLPRSQSCSNLEKEQEIPRDVLDMIADEIGRKWWDLARYLDLSEGTITDIESKYHLSLKQQAYQALLTFCRQPNTEGKRSILLAALANSRRVDLKTKVERELGKKNSSRKK